MRAARAGIVVVGAAVLGIVVAVGACTTGTGGVAGVARSQQQYCELREMRAKKCAPDGSTVSFSQSGCTNDYQCAVGIFAFPDAYIECRSSQDCAASVSDDRCITQSSGGRTVPASDKCTQKLAACKAAGGKSFDDDLCGVLGALVDGAVAQISSCFDQACDQVDDCVEAAVKRYTPSCD